MNGNYLIFQERKNPLLNIKLPAKTAKITQSVMTIIKTSRLLYFIGIATTILCCNPEQDLSLYEKKIITARSFFDASFYGANSVLEKSEIKNFNGLDCAH